MADYWYLRALAQDLMLKAIEDDTTDRVLEQLLWLEAEIRKDIEVFYSRYAKDHGLSYADALMYLTDDERREFRNANLAKFRELAMDPKTDPAILDALSYRHRITRKQALIQEIQTKVSAIYDEDGPISKAVSDGLTQGHAESAKQMVEDITRQIAKNDNRTRNDESTPKLKPKAPKGESNTNTSTDNKTAKNSQKQPNKEPNEKPKNIRPNITINTDPKLPEAMLDIRAGYNWSGKEFSERIWTHGKAHLDAIKDVLDKGLTGGWSQDRLVKELQRRTQVAKHNVERLIRTEMTAFASMATRDVLAGLGANTYKIEAIMDAKTSKVCQHQNGKIYLLSEFAIGKTAPPFHVHCRSKVVPVLGDEENEWLKANHPDQANTRLLDTEVSKDDNWTLDDALKWLDQRADALVQEAKRSKGIKYDGLANQRQGQVKPHKGLRIYEDRAKEIGEKYGLNPPVNSRHISGNGPLRDHIANNSASDKLSESRKIAEGKLSEIQGKEPKITEDMDRIAKESGGYLDGLSFRLKSLDSLARKIVTDAATDAVSLKEAAEKIMDVLRYTTIFDGETFVDDYNRMNSLLISGNYGIIKVKNTWPLPLPYKGVNTILEKDGIEFEMQYHTKESFDLKNGELHQLYEKHRSDGVSEEEKKVLTKRMKDLSKRLTPPKSIGDIKQK